MIIGLIWLARGVPLIYPHNLFEISNDKHQILPQFSSSVGWVERERNPTPTMSFVETLGFVPQPNLPLFFKIKSLTAKIFC